MKFKFLPIFQGVVRDYHPRLIPENKVANCENVMFKEGKVRSRYGMRRLGPDSLNGVINGIAYYEQVRSGDKYVLVFTSRDAYLYDTTTGMFTPISLVYVTGTVSVDAIDVTGSGTTWLPGSWTLDIYQMKFGTNSAGVTSVSFTGDTEGAWTERTEYSYWTGIASSSDGVDLAAITDGDYIFTSDDSGATWTERTNSGTRLWTGIASSSDGTKLAACVSNGYIYTSDDSGTTWTERTGAGTANWQGIASSSDGTKLAACVSNGYIYTSDDSGATWTERTGAGTANWQGIASSSDGANLAVCSLNAVSGAIYTSDDSGATWTERTAAGNGNWNCITSSSDGTMLAACRLSGYIYTSNDSGATWTERTSSGSRYWQGIASSSDGTKLAACVTSNGYIYLSDDSGATWTEQTTAGLRYWEGIASSSDGFALAACPYFGYIYTYSVSLEISSVSSLSNLYHGLLLSASFLQSGTRIVDINYSTSVITIDRAPLAAVSGGTISANISTWYDVASVDSGTGITLDDVVSTTGDTENGSAVIVNIPSTASLHAGMGITGSGIPAESSIVSIDSATQITISNNATATDTDVDLHFGILVMAGHEVDYVLRLCFNGDADDFWSFAYPYSDDVGDKMLVASNGIDPILKWDGSGSMEYLDGGAGMPETAKYVGYFGAAMAEHFIAAWTTDSGDALPQRIEVSDAGDAESWSGAYYDLLQKNDEIVGMEIIKDRLAIYKKKSISIAYADPSGTNEDPYNIAQDVIVDIEIPVGRTVVNFGDYHIFLGLDNVYRFDGIGITPIGTEIINTMKNEWNGEYMHHAFAFAIPGENLYCLFIPTLDQYDEYGNLIQAASEYPNKAYVYNYQEGSWTIWTFNKELTCAAFANKLYAPTVADIDALDQTWADMQMRWADLIAYSNIQSLLLGDVDGNVYEMRDIYTDDDEEDIDASFMTRDYHLNDPPNVFMLRKAILALKRQGEDDEIHIRASVDFGETWSGWVTLSEFGTNEYLEKIANFFRKGLQVRIEIGNISGAPFEIESINIGFEDGIPSFTGIGKKVLGAN